MGAPAILYSAVAEWEPNKEHVERLAADLYVREKDATWMDGEQRLSRFSCVGWSERQDRIEAARSLAISVRSMMAEDFDPDTH